MSSLIAAGKCCLDCSKTEDHESKSSIRENMFNHFLRITEICEDEVMVGNVKEIDLESLKFFIKQLEIECFDCEGSSRAVFEKIKVDHVKPMREMMSSALKEAERKKKKLKKEKSKKKAKCKVLIMMKKNKEL